MRIGCVKMTSFLRIGGWLKRGVGGCVMPTKALMQATRFFFCCRIIHCMTTEIRQKHPWCALAIAVFIIVRKIAYVPPPWTPSHASNGGGTLLVDQETGGQISRTWAPPTIVFCTSELETLTPGGAGVVVADSARALLRAGWHVVIVADIMGHDGVIDDDTTRAQLYEWRARAENAWVGSLDTQAPPKRLVAALDVILLQDLVSMSSQVTRQANVNEEKSRPLSRLLWQKSQLWSLAVHRIMDQMKIVDVAFEFWDCGAAAYHTLLWRSQRKGGNLPSLRVWIRTHGLHQAIRQSNGDVDRPPLQTIYRMEMRALQMADAVIANSLGTAREYQRAHNLDPRRIVVIPPTLGTLSPSIGLSLSQAAINPRLSSLTTHDAAANILVYGKLQKIKGPDIAAKALVRVMQDPSKRWRGTAIFAGDDMPCDTQPTLNMSSCILALHVLPASLKDRFRFVGRIDRNMLGAFARENGIRAAILPSRYETFCLAAHEIAHLRIPVLLPRLPAYDGYFQDRSNALMFEAGSVNDLARAITMAVTDDGVINQIKNKRNITYPDPSLGYKKLIFEVD